MEERNLKKLGKSLNGLEGFLYTGEGLVWEDPISLSRSGKGRLQLQGDFQQYLGKGKEIHLQESPFLRNIDEDFIFIFHFY